MLMKRMTLALALTAVLATAALAQTAAPPLPVKASPNPFITLSADGGYVGVNTQALVAASSVQGNDVLGLTGSNFAADGAAIGGDAGYIWGKCFLGSWCQAELGADWQNVSGGGASGSAMSTWSVYGEFDLGAQVFQTLIANAPWLNQLNAAFPTLANPSGLLPASERVATTPQQYFGAKVMAYQLGGSFGSATGESVAVAYGLDTGWRWQTLGANGQPNGGSFNLQAFALWPGRGVTMSDVFSTSGAPIIKDASVNQSTIFGVKLQYDLGTAPLFGRWTN